MDSSKVRMCFNGFYNSSINQDCIKVPTDGTIASFENKTADSIKESSIKKKLKTISNSMECYWELKTTRNAIPVSVHHCRDEMK